MDHMIKKKKECEFILKVALALDYSSECTDVSCQTAPASGAASQEAQMLCALKAALSLFQLF